MEVVIASSSSADAGIGCWDLQTGAEKLRYKTCASPSHGLTCVGQQFLASSIMGESPATSRSIFYWSWSKPQVEVKSNPIEPIKPLVANSDGTYIVGGGSSGSIYLWEVVSGRLLKKWPAHYRAVTGLVFNDDDSLLISGAEDGCVRVWSLYMIFDEIGSEQASHLYEHSFSDHSLPITDIVIGYGGCSAIIVSAAEDRTCKVWSLLKGKLIRNIVFPSIIDAIALDPGEHVFYAGGRDGKIYIAALNAESPAKNSLGLHIVGLLSEQHSKAVTCLALSLDGNLLISGSEDGILRVWDTKTRSIVRVFKHSKGPVNNVIVVRRSPCAGPNSQASSRRHAALLAPPLKKYVNSIDANSDSSATIVLQSNLDRTMDFSYLTPGLINDQIKQLKEQGTGAAEMELERQKVEFKKSMQMVQQWKHMYDNLHEFCSTEILDRENGIPAKEL